MPDDNSLTPAPVDSPPKARSPVERAIVHGGILVLLVLVGIESIGYLGQRSALASLTERLEKGDPTGHPLKAADVKALLGREPIHVEDVTERNLSINAKRVEVYRWFTLSPIKKRELYVYYGIGTIDDPKDTDVINVSTDEDTDIYQHAKPVKRP